MTKLLRNDALQILLLAALTAFGLGAVYWVNQQLGYGPSLTKGVRNLSIVLLVLPTVIGLRLTGYRGTIRLMALAATLMAIGLVIRYDYEIKSDYNTTLKIAAGDATPEEAAPPDSFSEVWSPILKASLGFLALFSVYLVFRKNPAILSNRTVTLGLLVFLPMLAHLINRMITHKSFVFGFTLWDLSLPLLVVMLADYLAQNHRGLAEIKRSSLPEPIYWIPLVILWIIPAASFVIIKEFGVFVILGLYLILMLYLATRRFFYVAASFLIMSLFLMAVIHFDLVGGHVGVRLSIWTDFYKGFPADLSPYHPMINSQSFLDWLGSPNLRSQHLSGFLGVWHGGLTGVGLGLGYPNAIPLAVTDFIGPALAESLGLSGLLIVAVLYISIVYHYFRESARMDNLFGAFVLQGLGLMMLIEFVVALSGPLSIIPMTGVPMPFVSRGNSQLIASLASIGLAMAFEQQGAVNGTKYRE